VGAEQPPYADESDERLVERCREAVDQAAFAELVRRYRDRRSGWPSRFSDRSLRMKPKTSRRT
jgi:hypothetical protein